MYCTVYMFTDCICLVMLTKWMTKKEKEFWCAIWKFALASLFMFSFSVLLRKKNKKTKCRLYSKAVLTQHSLPIPAQPFRASKSIPGAWGQSPTGLAQGEESGHSLGIALDHLPTKRSVFSSWPAKSHSDIPGVGPCDLQPFPLRRGCTCALPAPGSGSIFFSIIGIALKKAREMDSKGVTGSLLIGVPIHDSLRWVTWYWVEVRSGYRNGIFYSYVFF